MKIKGPGGPTLPPEIEKPQETSKKPFPSTLGEAAKTGGPSGPGGSEPVARIAADLKAGRIDAKQAVARLLELTMADGPAAHLPPRVQAKIRADLEDLMKHDPFLRSKLEKLGVPSDPPEDGE